MLHETKHQKSIRGNLLGAVLLPIFLFLAVFATLFDGRQPVASDSAPIDANEGKEPVGGLFHDSRTLYLQETILEGGVSDAEAYSILKRLGFFSSIGNEEIRARLQAPSMFLIVVQEMARDPRPLVAFAGLQQLFSAELLLPVEELSGILNRTRVPKNDALPTGMDLVEGIVLLSLSRWNTDNALTVILAHDPMDQNVEWYRRELERLLTKGVISEDYLWPEDPKLSSSMRDSIRFRLKKLSERE